MKEIEIFNNENSMALSDEHDNLTLYFFPDTKEFKSTFSLNDDVYYRNELYEYKISTNPIEVFIRLKERSDEPPPDDYVVKDGVVLESEIRKDKGFRQEEFIKNLKEDTEWHRLELFGGYAQLFYILSLHPEIISKEEYRKFLRQTEQRIKIGLLNIQKYLDKNDTTGLKILTKDNSSYIWYPEANNSNYKELENKYSEYRENSIYKPLFSESSPDYSGISKYEFEMSSDIIKHLENLLNEKEAIPYINKKKNNNNKRTIAFIVGAFLVIGTLGGDNLNYITNWSTAELIGYNTWTLIALFGGAFLIYKSIKK